MAGFLQHLPADPHNQPDAIAGQAVKMNPSLHADRLPKDAAKGF